ncbi:DUF1294 domain-containing protein [Sulfurimonas sp.]
MQKVIFAYFIFINVAAFLIYWFDKHRAKSGKRRISESELHTFALLGGFLGATLSMYIFRHKTSKSSFLIVHIGIILLWIVGILYYFFDLNELNFIQSLLLLFK